MSLWPLGVEGLIFDAIDSTSDEARRRAAAGARGPLWIAARRQTAGRGRRGRPWVSEPGNLFATLLLAPDLSPIEAGRLSFVAAVALAEVIEPLVPGACPLTLKWPNDVLLDGAKVAGILLESQSGPAGRIDWLTIGIGVNLAHAPQGTETRAASLADFGIDLGFDAALAALARRLDAGLERFRDQGFAACREAWMARAAGLGAPIAVRLPSETLTGTFADLDLEGGLILDQNGSTRRIAAGEVFLT